MKQKWSLNQEAFDKLLSWLDPDPERAGLKYEEIRSKLIRIYSRRGCTAAEELVDETMDRVTRKIQQVAVDYEGDPALYFYRVAHNIYLEYLKKKPAVEISEGLRLTEQPPSPKLSEEKEHAYECLEHCLERLNTQAREIILGYYQEEKSAKIVHRKVLAEKFDLTLKALRTRVHRIRSELEKCLNECVRQAEI